MTNKNSSRSCSGVIAATGKKKIAFNSPNIRPTALNAEQKCTEGSGTKTGQDNDCWIIQRNIQGAAKTYSSCEALEDRAFLGKILAN